VVGSDGTVTTTNPGANTSYAYANGDSLYAAVYVYAADTTTSGRNVIQAESLALPVQFDANGNDTALATSTGDIITIANGFGGTKDYGYVSSTITTVDQLVAAMNGATDVPNLTVEADRDAYHEQIVTISWTYSDGTAAAASSTVTGKDKLYFTYGTDPETGASIATQATVTAGSQSGALAIDIATALNNATHAYVATGTTDGKIRITALVSGTTKEDRGPIPHAFQTLSVSTSSDSSTLQLAGANANHIIAASSSSNTTAIASELFNFATSSTSRSGVRVTIKNSSTTVDYSGMSVTVASASSAAFKGNDSGTAALAEALATSGASQNMVGASISSSALDYVAAFSDIESQTTTTDVAAQTTDRTGWL